MSPHAEHDTPPKSALALVIADCRALNALFKSFRHMGHLALLDIPVLVLDVAYDALDDKGLCNVGGYVKSLIDANSPPFKVVGTYAGAFERSMFKGRPGRMRAARHDGAVANALAEFLGHGQGIERHLEAGVDVVVVHDVPQLDVRGRSPAVTVMGTADLLNWLDDGHPSARRTPSPAPARQWTP